MTRTSVFARITTMIVVGGSTFGAGADTGDGSYRASSELNPSRFTYDARFSSKMPARPTAFEQVIDYLNPEDPGAKPPAISQVHVILPRGSRIDSAVPPACAASDLELILAGAAACPAATRVGRGTLNADTGAPGESGGFPRSVETEVSFFNGEDDLIFVAESTNTLVPLRIPSRFEVGRRSFTSSVPPLPAAPPPDPFLAIDFVSNSLDRVVSADGSYIRTPRRCPAGRRWRFTAEVTFRDGLVQRRRSAMRCRRRAR